MTKLDFCIMQDPINRKGTPIVFFTKAGKTFLDESVIKSLDYENVISIMKNFGYVESDVLTFEFSRDPDYDRVDKKELLLFLEEEGFNYNYRLEKGLAEDFEKAKNILLQKAKLSGIDTSDISLYLKSPMEPEDYFKKTSTLYEIPKVGGKITLYFYLFLECKFKNGNCYLNLNGDFSYEKDSKLKNLLQVSKFDFIRTNNTYNPNVIILKSVLTNGEIVRTLPVHIEGSFVKTEKEKEKTFVYHLMEVKNNIPSKNRITIEVENISNFDNMMLISNEIKRDYKIQMKRKVNIEKVGNVLRRCSIILNKKMLNYANDDKFENASIVKKDISYIKSSLENIDILEENIPMRFFLKKYHIN